MRTASPSMLKGKSQPAGQLPSEGSRLRLVYDQYYEYRGRPMPASEKTALRELCGSRNGRAHGDLKNCLSSQRAQLEDFYGCDFRKIPGSGCETVLVGEWVGRVYIDYYAEVQRSG